MIVKEKENVSDEEQSEEFDEKKYWVDELENKFDKDTQSRLDTLRDKKLEALRVNDASAAAEISRLEVQEMQFAQKTRQDAISNMFSVAGLQQNQQQIDASVAQAARTQSQGDLRIQIEEDRLALQQEDNLANRLFRGRQLEIQEQELVLKQIQAGQDPSNVTPSPGFSDYKTQLTFGTTSQPLKEAARTRYEANVSLLGEEVANERLEQDLMTAFDDLRTLFTVGQVTDEALLKSLGLQTDEEKATAEEARLETLPGEVDGGILGSIGGVLNFPPKAERVGIRDRSEAKKKIKQLEGFMKNVSPSTKAFMQSQIDDLKREFSL